jgi:hypothetical protein
VPIEIRGYNNNGYSAIVYNQRCKSCDRLGTFELNERSYTDGSRIGSRNGQAWKWRRHLSMESRAHHMSGPIAKAVNEGNVEREMDMNCIRRSESTSTFMSTIGYFVSVFEMFGGL